MTPPILSIAIPAYDRVAELKYALERFVEQIEGRFEDEVEIRISDDCSPGDSLAEVRAFCSRYSFLHYRRYDDNIGLERNLVRCTEKCTGEFLWLFGDDDFLERDTAIETVLDHLKTGMHDMLVLNRTRRDASLSKLLHENWMKVDPDSSITFSGLSEFALRFGFISVVGFISVNVFRRSPFLRTDFEKYMGTMYPHLGGLFEAFHDRPTLLVGEPLVCHRTQTEEEKRAALGAKRSEADFMSDVDRRNAIYFSHPYIAMLDELLDCGAFLPADLPQIPENTVINGKLIDFLIHAVELNAKLGVGSERASWERTDSFFARLPLSETQRTRVKEIVGGVLD